MNYFISGEPNSLSSPMKAIIASVLTVMLAGCTTSVTVQGRAPTPVVAQIPARIGIYYSEEFKSYEHEESIEQAGTWRVNLGNQNLVFFRNLFEALFVSVREVGEPPLPRSEMEGLDGVIEPRIVEYGFLTPQVSGLKFYSASIEYELVLYDAAGQRLGSWKVVGYGKSEPGVFGHDKALGEATRLAIRDGGARIAIGLNDRPEVSQWLNSRQTATIQEQ